MAKETKYISPKQSLGEEIANSITHGIGAALGTAALVILVVLASIKGDAWRVVSFSIYGFISNNVVPSIISIPFTKTLLPSTLVKLTIDIPI